jgi:endonuclease/exonuclease/phosphatase family metal-dependent hydrolase
VLTLARVRRTLAPALLLGGLALLLTGCPQAGSPTPGSGGGPGTYLLCSWNVENFFDDRPDGWNKEPDRSFDRWFANNPEVLRAKLDRLCQVLLSDDLSGGRGPDILAVAEVESYRAAELLRDALNARLRDPALHYPTVVYKDPAGGRNIACAVITRLRVDEGRTRLLGKRQRILEVHVEAAGQDLVVVASHWSSRLRDKGKGRAHYADQIYGRFRAMYRQNPKVDFLVCGDFNDNPDDPSVVDHLHAIDNLEKVRRGGPEPYLYNLFAPLWARGEGTLYFGKRPQLFDQVCVSPGLLDGEGWTCDVKSARIVKQIALRNGRPDRFGGPSPRDKRPLSKRGASDHFPVTVRLSVAR